jgi:hypothetical protein
MSKFWPLIKLLPTRTNFEFVKHARLFGSLSLILVISSIFFIIYPADNKCGGLTCGVDFLGEIGPQLTWRAWEESNRSLTINLPVRASLSFGDGGIRSRGLVLNPRITYRDRDFVGGNTLSLGIGPIFATEKLMDYFYEVRPQFALRDRPAFDADSGYLGSEISIGLSRRLTPQVRLFVGSQVGLFNGATNRRSTLLARETNWNFAFGASWAIWESSKRATD